MRTRSNRAGWVRWSGLGVAVWLCFSGVVRVSGAADPAGAKEPEGRRLGFHLDFAFAKYRSDYLKELLPQLRKWGYNTLIWELEDAVRFATCPEVAAPDAMSGAELAELAAYARKLGFENIPVLQTMAHCSYVLRHKEYEYLSEKPGTLELYCLSRPDAGQFLIRLANELVSLFGGVSRFHIGADEAWTIGRDCGLCKRHVEQFGAADLMAKHLAPITEALLARGIRPVMWADMVHTHPEMRSRLDPRIIMADWYYEYPERSFRSIKGVRRKTDVFTDAAELRRSGRTVWGCSASRSYGGSVFAPEYDRYAQNYRRWMRAAGETPLDGLMLTSWSVHLYPLELQAPVLALAAYAGLPAEQGERAFVKEYFGTEDDAFFRAVRLLSDPVYLSLTASVGHNQIIPSAPADAVARSLGKLEGAARETRLREAERLRTNYREAAALLADFQKKAKRNAGALSDWRLAADNLTFRADLQRYFLAPEPDDALRQALRAGLPALRDRTGAMYRAKVRPANAAQILAILFDPVEEALKTPRARAAP